MKKFSIITLILCLIFSLLYLAGCSKKEISALNITDIPVAVAGEAIADANVVIENQEGFTLETEWQVWDDELEDFAPFTDATFEANQTYKVAARLVVEKGYAFAEDIEVEVPDTCLGWSSWLEESGEFFIDFGIAGTTTGIYTIDVKDDFVEVGNNIVLPEIDLLDGYGNSIVEAGKSVSDYIDLTLEWKYQEPGSDESVPLVSTVFQENYSYILAVDAIAKEGYHLAEDISISFNGTDDLVHYDTLPVSLEHRLLYSTMAPIEKFELSGLPEAKAGETMPSELTLVSDIPDCYIGIFWLDEEGNELYEEQFESGKTYTLQISINPSGEYTIAEDPVVIIDGKTYGPEDYQSSDEDVYLELEYKIS